MNLITLAQARAHCRADAADDAELTLCVNAAEKACAHMANRNLYATQGDLTAALGTISASMVAANAAYAAAVLAADAMSIAADRLVAKGIAESNLRAATAANSAILSGMVATDDVIAAVLLTTAHFYRNREEVMTGSGAAAVQLPMGAQAIMQMNRVLGPL